LINSFKVSPLKQPTNDSGKAEETFQMFLFAAEAGKKRKLS
jgi:hypothetical protein